MSALTPNYEYTGFVTAPGGYTYYDFVGMAALIDDAYIQLSGSTDHVVEYVDSVATGTCRGIACWAQSGWGMGYIGMGQNFTVSGPNQRPYYEHNDVNDYYPHFFTNLGVHCCGTANVNNTSTFWDGAVDGAGNGEFISYFNNYAGSGNYVVGYAHLAGYVREDMTGEEESALGGAYPVVGPVTFSGAQLDWSQLGVFSPWTSSDPGALEQNPPFYPFLAQTDYTSFEYSGP